MPVPQKAFGIGNRRIGFHGRAQFGRMSREGALELIEGLPVMLKGIVEKVLDRR